MRRDRSGTSTTGRGPWHLLVGFGVLTACEACALAAEAGAGPGVGGTETLPDLPDYTAALVRMLITLVAMVLGLLALARFLPAWLGKRRTAHGDGIGLDVVSTRRLEAGRSLHVVKAGGRTLLVGSGPQGLNLIADLTDGGDHSVGQVLRTRAPSEASTSRFGASLVSTSNKEPAHARVESVDPAGG